MKEVEVGLGQLMLVSSLEDSVQILWAWWMEGVCYGIVGEIGPDL